MESRGSGQIARNVNRARAASAQLISKVVTVSVFTTGADET